MANKNGMFDIYGATPEDVQQNELKQIQNKALQDAQMSNRQQLIQMSSEGGGLLGSAMEKLAGYESPELKKANQMKSVKGQINAALEQRGIDSANNPYEASKLSAKILYDNGMTKAAQKAMAWGSQFKPTTADWGAPFKQNGDLYQRNNKTGQIKKLDNAPKTVINNSQKNVDAGDKKFAEETAKHTAGEAKEIYTNGVQASKTINLIKDMNSIIAKVPESGSFADLQLSYSKVLHKFGMSDKQILSLLEKYKTPLNKNFKHLSSIDQAALINQISLEGEDAVNEFFKAMMNEQLKAITGGTK